MSEPADGLDIRRIDGVLQVTLDRPAKKNAITLDMWHRLAALMHDITAEPGLDVVVLRGRGRDFSAGADIGEFPTVRATQEQIQAYGDAVEAAERAIGDLRIPVVAELRGYCLGGGLELALACDFRYADDTARASIPAAKAGIVYSEYSTRRLAAAVGSTYSKYMMYTAATVGADEALRHGLFDAVVRPDELAGRVSELVAVLRQNSSYTVAAAKEIIESGIVGRPVDAFLVEKLRAQAAGSARYQATMGRFNLPTSGSDSVRE